MHVQLILPSMHAVALVQRIKGPNDKAHSGLRTDRTSSKATFSGQWDVCRTSNGVLSVGTIRQHSHYTNKIVKGLFGNASEASD